MKDSGKMRILEVCTVPTEKSGIPNVIFNLMSQMDKTSVEMGYVAINEPPLFYRNKLKELGVSLHVISRKIKSPISYIRNLSRVASGYDVIHVHGNSATMLLEMVAAKIAGVPVRSTHSHSSSCLMKGIDRLARPFFYHLCNLNLACSIKAGEWLYRKRPYKVIRNGIRTSRYQFSENDRRRVRDRLNLNNKVVIGNVANFDYAKNHAYLLRIFQALLKDLPECVLLLVGEGERKEKLLEEARALGIGDNVIFTGSVDNPWEYMSAMDVIVMPSLYEGFPLTLIEEQANGLSCVVSEGISHEVDLTGNLRFIPLDSGVEIWKKGIISILKKNGHDSASSQNSISSIKNSGYDIKEAASELIDIFNQKLKTVKK